MSGYLVGIGAGQSGSTASGRKAYTRISVAGGTVITDLSDIILPASTNQDVLDAKSPRFMKISVPENQSNFYFALGESVVLTTDNEVYFQFVPKGFEWEFQITGQAVHAACKTGLTSKIMLWESV